MYPKKSIDHQGRERFHPLNMSTHLAGNVEWLYEYAANPVKQEKIKIQRKIYKFFKYFWTFFQGIKCCSETTISFHKTDTDEMKRLYQIWMDIKKNGTSLNFLFLEMLHKEDKKKFISMFDNLILLSGISH